MNRRKMLGALLALVLAVVSTAALVRYVKGAEDRALAGEELVEVLVVSKDVPAGTSSVDLASLVTAEKVPAKVRAQGAVSSFTQLDGLIASTDLVAGEQLITARFVNPANFQGARNSSVRVPSSANEVTIKLAPERALGGQLRPGDFVTVLASFEPFDREVVDPVTGDAKTTAKVPNTAHVLLNKALVVKVQFPPDASTSDKEKNGVGEAPTAEILVTFALDQPSVERLVYTAEFGKLWLSYEPPTAIDTENKEVVRDNVYDATRPLLPPDPVSAKVVSSSVPKSQPITPTASEQP